MWYIGRSDLSIHLPPTLTYSGCADTMAIGSDRASNCFGSYRWTGLECITVDVWNSNVAA